jgi:hypothetical protein
MSSPILAASLIACLLVPAALAAAETKYAVFDPTAEHPERKFTPDCDQVAIKPGLLVTINPGAAGYPGIDLHGNWDFDGFSHVEARVTNTGSSAIDLSLRVDNGGDWHNSPWDTEASRIEAGQTGTITVYFGYAYGDKPGYKLDPKAVVNLKLFTAKTSQRLTFRIDGIFVGGRAGEHPPGT